MTMPDEEPKPTAAPEPADAPEPLTPPPPGAAPTTAVPATGVPMPIPLPPRAGPPAGSAYGYPARYAAAPGTGQFQLALPQLGTIVAGPAVGSLVAGIAAIVVSFGLMCAGATGNAIVIVAVTVLGVFFVAAAGLLAAVSLRQIKRSAGEYRGRGMAIAGIACGGAAAVILFFVVLVVAAINM